MSSTEEPAEHPHHPTCCMRALPCMLGLLRAELGLVVGYHVLCCIICLYLFILLKGPMASSSVETKTDKEIKRRRQRARERVERQLRGSESG